MATGARLEVAVQALETRHDCAGAVLADSGEPALAQACAQLGLVQQQVQCIAQSDGITWRHEQARLVMAHHFL